jgi:hypothetical protein
MDPLEKENFLITIDYIIPVQVTYKILASSPDEAISIIEKNNPLKNIYAVPNYSWARFKRIITKVYKIGSSNILKVKKYIY